MLINEILAKKLVTEQFPEWANLQVWPVEKMGHDNRTFRLGQNKLIRIPSEKKYATQVLVEQKWLQFLQKNLSIKIPKPLAMGSATEKLPWNWSIYEWIDGAPASEIELNYQEKNTLALDLAAFLNNLHLIDATKGPMAGGQNFYRGGNLEIYNNETINSLKKLETKIDSKKALIIWQEALSSTWTNQGLWVHGDLSSSNILLKANKLEAVIDFGCLATGDPACDLMIYWFFFGEESKKVFKSTLKLDEEIWQRARGWALWKSCFELAGALEKKDEEKIHHFEKVVNDILSD